MSEVAPRRVHPARSRSGRDGGNLDAIANIGFIVGNDAVLVTDSGGSLRDGQWLRAQIRAGRTSRSDMSSSAMSIPITRSARALSSRTSRSYIGHAKLPEALKRAASFTRKGLADIIGADKVGPVVMPTQNDGGRPTSRSRRPSDRLQGAWTGTHDVRPVDARQAKAGCSFRRTFCSSGAFPRSMATCSAGSRSWTCLRLCGRAMPCRATGLSRSISPAAASALRAYLVALRDGVRAEIKSGGSIDAAVKTVAQTEQREMGCCSTTTMGETSPKPIKNSNGNKGRRERWTSSKTKRFWIAGSHGRGAGGRGHAGFAGVGDTDQERQRAGRICRSTIFGDKTPTTDDKAVQLDAPVRALDASLVPITITLANPKDVKGLYLVIDDNPSPVAAHFTFGPDADPKSIKLRVRVNTYTDMHAVIETKDGKLARDHEIRESVGRLLRPDGHERRGGDAGHGRDEAQGRRGRRRRQARRCDPDDPPSELQRDADEPGDARVHAGPLHPEYRRHLRQQEGLRSRHRHFAWPRTRSSLSAFCPTPPRAP